MTLRPGTKPRLGKGQPEGIVVTGRTGKLGVAEESLVLNDAAGQNNSNLASLLTSVINDGWELILAVSSHYCFYTFPKILLISFIFYPLSFSPKGERLVPLLHPWGKAGKGVYQDRKTNINRESNIMNTFDS
jgi:hypothetical protein